MSELKKAFDAKRKVLVGSAASENAIAEAEKKLGLVFASDYREYLGNYGIAAYDGHELTGITQSPRLNVVDVTRQEGARFDSIPKGCYVIERTGVEEIIVWQSESGEIYYSSPNVPLTKMCGSLAEYISK